MARNKYQVKQWTLRSFIEQLLLFIASILITIFLIFLLICWHGYDVQYIDDDHILYSIFEDKQYTQLQKAISQKNLKRIEIVGSIDGGVRQFIENYANNKVLQGQYVVMDDIYQSAKHLRPYVSQLRYQLLKKIGWYRFRRNLGMESTIHPIRIVIQTQYLSEDYLNYLLHLDPKDKVILVSSDKMRPHKIEGFTKFNFTSINETKFKKYASKKLKIPLKTFDILFYHFQTIDKIFELIDQDQNSLNQELILEQFEQSLSPLSSSDLTILQNLCSKGAYKQKIISKQLYYFGTVKIKNTIYWVDPLAMLNYQLKTFEKCSLNGILPEKLKNVELDWDQQLYEEFL